MKNNINKSNFKIEIPKPCYESWESMLPAEDGRFCTVCDKVVIDFTSMSDLEIKDYFLKISDTKLCGRFNAKNVHSQENIALKWIKNTESWMVDQLSTRFVHRPVVLLLGTFISLASCEMKKTGEVEVKGKVIKKTDTTSVDTTKVSNPTMGLPMSPKEDTTQKKKN